MRRLEMSVREHCVHYLEIVTPDVAGACAFYSKVHGWKFEETGPELGGSMVAVLPDGSRCGIRAPMRATENPIVRAYVRVDDVVEAARVAAEAGAFVALEPTKLGGHGTIAIYIHGGVEQGLWQLA